VEDIFRGERRITSTDIPAEPSDGHVRWGVYAFDGGVCYGGYWRDGVMTGWGVLFWNGTVSEGMCGVWCVWCMVCGVHDVWCMMCTDSLLRHVA